MIHEMSVQELERKFSKGDAIILVDVREPDEHAIASLPESVLIPMGELSQRWMEIEPAEGKEIVVYCHHGIRSRHAANFLSQCGLKPIFSLAGGIDAWSRLIDPKIPRY
jgi:rhodanese-related sulfurtransferase